jgi:hypothetical protein
LRDRFRGERAIGLHRSRVARLHLGYHVIPTARNCDSLGIPKSVKL